MYREPVEIGTQRMTGADEMAEHLVLHCPAHDQARWESWPNLHYQSDPRRLGSFLERIGAVTRPPTGNEKERLEIGMEPRCGD